MSGRDVDAFLERVGGLVEKAWDVRVGKDEREEVTELTSACVEAVYFDMQQVLDSLVSPPTHSPTHPPTYLSTQTRESPIIKPPTHQPTHPPPPRPTTSKPPPAAWVAKRPQHASVG